MRKKILSLFLALVTSVGMMHAAVDDSGSCGDGLTWELNGGVLTISYDGEGTGEMYDFGYEYDESPVNVAPWKENKSEITTVIVGDGVKSIGNHAFNDLSENFTAVTIANSVERIGLNAFMNAEEITEITLPSSLKTIDEQGFANCGFTSITIPSGVTSIGYRAFCYCRGLTSLTCEATTPPTLASGVFYKISGTSSIPLYVPNGSVDAYTAAAQWNAFNVQAIPAPYAVEFALGDAEGTAPAAVDVTIGKHITMPVNKTMYKAGYTLTGWSDGVNTYPIGESFTPANDVVLTPVFTANEADLLNASSNVTVKWYFGGDNGAPTTSYEGTSGLLVAQATIGDKTVDVKLAIDATSGKFAPQPTTEWAQVVVGTIFTYPYKEGMTVNVGNYKSKVTYYIADAEGKVTCGENDHYSFIQVTYPASQPTGVEDVQSDKVQATKFFRDGQLLIEKNGKTYTITGSVINE